MKYVIYLEIDTPLRADALGRHGESSCTFFFNRIIIRNINNGTIVHHGSNAHRTRQRVGLSLVRYHLLPNISVLSAHPGRSSFTLGKNILTFV